MTRPYCLNKIQAEPVFLKNLSTQHNIATEKMTEVMFQDLIARSRHRKKLLRNNKAYKLTEAEVEQTKIALQQYESELKAYNEKGGD